jgi:F-type H+-transporting ATPase subunit delta
MALISAALGGRRCRQRNRTCVRLLTLPVSAYLRLLNVFECHNLCNGAPLSPLVAVPALAKVERCLTAPCFARTLQVEYEAVGTAYANALLSTAQSNGSLEAVHADIDAIASVMKDSADIKEFLGNPTVPEEKKKQMIAKMAGESGFNSYTVNFLNILVDQSRIDAISEVCDAFEAKYCELTDTQVATLRSAVKLEQEQQFLIAKKLQELTKSKNVKIKPVVDESLIAGFVVEWGSSQIDLSVKGQLDKIGNELMATANSQ